MRAKCRDKIQSCWKDSSMISTNRTALACFDTPRLACSSICIRCFVSLIFFWRKNNIISDCCWLPPSCIELLASDSSSPAPPPSLLSLSLVLFSSIASMSSGIEASSSSFPSSSPSASMLRSKSSKFSSSSSSSLSSSSSVSAVWSSPSAAADALILPSPPLGNTSPVSEAVFVSAVEPLELFCLCCLTFWCRVFISFVNFSASFPFIPIKLTFTSSFLEHFAFTARRRYKLS
mmetsp:Transcript_874/g.1491  ORF Transcript_874/g.1491 Transcript_874/m.1491 type:complete len:233 (-) Transcript_874:544-1242(-)